MYGRCVDRTRVPGEGNSPLGVLVGLGAFGGIFLVWVAALSLFALVSAGALYLLGQILTGFAN